MGPKLLLEQVKLARKYLNAKEISALHDSFNSNGHWSSHENILLCCVSSLEKDERLIGVDIILHKLRVTSDQQEATGKKEIRVVGPEEYKVNIEATSLVNLNVNSLYLAKTEPPATLKMSNEEIELLREKPLELSLPLSTVSVERAVKETTRTSLMAYSELERDGIMMQAKKSRKRESSK